MIQECEICGNELEPSETAEVCADCREETIFDCSSCGAEMDWKDRDHVCCSDCRELSPGATATTGRG